ncbi:unnamed protein product [Darwinula stevensoni]|uniref:Uncharacterized protein n=1 Tax=Darwinula stevensoni TaxID=69355 RepID=A0A7R9FSD9_9CRUS|nr:unnamed protein product [Darwinula stevensoni]CAG0903308.1 unnamed protein product [Darwinula stevensoni]
MTCRSLRLAPPPGAASALASRTHDESLKTLYFRQQLEECSREFGQLMQGYEKLFKASFDADPKTLVCLLLMEHSCGVVKTGIDAFILRKEPTSSFDIKPRLRSNLESLGIEMKPLWEACQEAQRVFLEISKSNKGIINHEETEVMMKASQILSSLPLGLPRFFFQTLQTTSIKMAVSPQPYMEGGAISVQTQAHLTVKVEGVIQQGGGKIFHIPHKILITVHTQLTSSKSLPPSKVKYVDFITSSTYANPLRTHFVMSHHLENDKC